MRRWIAAGAALVLAAAACGDAALPADAGSAPPLAEPPPTAGDAGRLGELCAGVVGALADGDAERFISTTEDIHGLLSGLPGGEHAVDLISSIGDDLPSFEDRPLSPETLAAIGPGLIALSGELHSLGAEPCAAIGEVASAYVAAPAPDPATALEDLRRYRQTWDERRPPTYAMELAYHDQAGSEPVCGQGDLLVQVVEGRVALAVDRYSGCRVPEGGPVPVTVDDLFDLVEASLGADVLEVDYEPDLGYPRHVFVDDGDRVIEAGVIVFTPGVVTTGADSVLGELRGAERAWAEMGPADYDMTVELLCFCPPEFTGPFDVTVVGGEIERVERVGQDVTATVDHGYLTVPGLFTAIADAAYADDIDVSYHPLGYPTRIAIDVSKNTIDEELTIVVTRLEPGG